jgi:hypothetical protein
MRFAQLRRVLQNIVLAGLPASLAACGLYGRDDGSVTDGSVTDGGTGDAPCDHIERHSVRLEQPGPQPLQFAIDTCRVDVDACDALCWFAMASASVSGRLLECEPGFAEDRVELSVTVSVWDGGPHCPVDGRRPEGLQATRLSAPSAVGAWLAQAAWLEAASVHAFVRLAHELGLHGAPRALIRAALAAVGDEVRHTAMMARLAARYGAVPPVPEVAPPVARSLEALAVENAVEGCVRETWAAALALWQSHAAHDPEVRAAFEVIARDELRHAALAWAIDGWAMPQLDEAARARVRAARDVAADELVRGGDSQALGALGVPDGAALQGLAQRAQAALWQGGVSCHA